MSATDRKIVKRSGGWFAETSNGWSGPWASEAAAKAAQKGEYSKAWELQRLAKVGAA